jgi:hypothetical protein
MFNTDEFSVYMLDNGIAVVEEWTGKKPILRSFSIN